MRIFLGILAFIILLVTVILLLPVYIIIKTDKNGEMIFRYKILFKTFGEDPDPDNPIVNTLKEISGVTRLDKEKLKESVKKGNLLETLNDSFALILGLLKRLLGLLKFCTVKVLRVKIVCAESDAAQTAIDYGRCYAAISPLVSFLHSKMKIRKKGEDINITCNFETRESSYDFEAVLVVRVFRILVALFHAAFDEVKRVSQNEASQNKNQA